MFSCTLQINHSLIMTGNKATIKVDIKFCSQEAITIIVSMYNAYKILNEATPISCPHILFSCLGRNQDQNIHYLERRQPLLICGFGAGACTLSFGWGSLCQDTCCGQRKPIPPSWSRICHISRSLSHPLKKHLIGPRLAYWSWLSKSSCMSTYAALCTMFYPKRRWWHPKVVCNDGASFCVSDSFPLTFWSSSSVYHHTLCSFQPGY